MCTLFWSFLYCIIMRPVVTDMVACTVSLSVRLSLCLSWSWTWLGTRNCIRREVQILHANGQLWGEKGRPIGRRTYDCTVPIGLRQPLSGPFILEKCSLRLVSRPRSLFYWVQGIASMRQEEPTALKWMHCIHEYAHEIAVIRSLFSAQNEEISLSGP